MAEKISTLILKVDLECHLCYKKIRKVLCKLQDREKIRSITYDEKNNTVIVSGPFDPHHLSKKLRCKACKVIKDIEIKQEKEKPKEEKPAGPPPPKPEKEKPKPVEPAKPSPPKPKEDPPKTKPKEDPPPKPKEDPPPKPKEDPPKPKEDPPKPKSKDEPVFVAQVPEAYPPVWPSWPPCDGGPWYDGYYMGCRCGCGRMYGCVGGPSYDGNPRTCRFFCEEETSSCVIM